MAERAKLKDRSTRRSRIVIRETIDALE